VQAEIDLVPFFDGIDSPAAASSRRLAIVSEIDGELMGTIGFRTISDINRTAEIAP
jgi:ribosomal-protein-alanine N-acetyltransferase